MAPSVEVAAVVEFRAIAAKVDAPKATEFQLGLSGRVRAVQVMPSVEEAAVVELWPRVTKVDAPKAKPYQL